MTVSTFTSRVLLASALVLGVTSTAGAQVHLQALGGITDAADTDSFLGGALGARIGFFEINGEAGRLRNALPSGLLSDLNRYAQDLFPGQSLSVSMPVTYAKGSIRFIGPSGPVRPFLGGGLGVARVNPEINVGSGGVFDDLTDLAVLRSSNKTLATAEVGVRFDLGSKVLLDVGYRYWRIFADYREFDEIGNDNVLGHVNSGFAGLGIKF